ncbi:MAG: replication-relaxation family protein [Thermoanaerobaculia bacterium]|jgi:hypothetical protein
MTTNDSSDISTAVATSAPRDPRQTVEPTARDVRVLARIAAGEWLAQYQIHVLEFDGKSETVVSRSTRRLWTRGLIRIERFRGQGINLTRLTEAGADYLLERKGATAAAIFVSRRKFDPRQLAHHLSVIDAFVALKRVQYGCRVLTCWQLRRSLANRNVPIPDLLVANLATNGTVAIEIDRGTESLGGASGFVEKLRRLAEFEELWGGATTRAIVVLTLGKSRLESLRSRLSGGTSVTSVPVTVLALPQEVGRPAIAALEKLLGPP